MRISACAGTICLGAALLLGACRSRAPQAEHTVTGPAVVLQEFVFTDPPTPECHASTLAEADDGLVAAWFGGAEEGETGVGIWLARKTGGGWSAPVEVANGVMPSGKRYPCWNPVLFKMPDGPLLLFYKVGPSPREWWGMRKRSSNGGKTWSAPVRLPEGILGPIKNKPVLLADGTLLCGSSTEHAGWRVHMEMTADQGETWRATGPLNAPEVFGAIQPTILVHGDGRLQILCRSRQNVITRSWSEDSGRTWGPMTATSLPNPNSGIDAVTLRSGRHLLVYNPTTGKAGHGGPRIPLTVALSKDGRAWQDVAVLEPVVDPATIDAMEYSYPAVIQTRDGLVHITYTWNRKKIKHVVLDPAKLL